MKLLRNRATMPCSIISLRFYGRKTTIENEKTVIEQRCIYEIVSCQKYKADWYISVSSAECFMLRQEKVFIIMKSKYN